MYVQTDFLSSRADIWSIHRLINNFPMKEKRSVGFHVVFIETLISFPHLLPFHGRNKQKLCELISINCFFRFN